MAQAVQELFPNTKITLGPPIEDGFYYDFESPHPFTPDDLPKIEARMNEIVNGNHAFVMSTHSAEESKAYWRKGLKSLKWK
jgi:threonyl-tRNA synthetase